MLNDGIYGVDTVCYNRTMELTTRQQNMCVREAKRGASVTAVALMLGCDRSTFYKYMASEPEFNERFQNARGAAATQAMAHLHRTNPMAWLRMVGRHALDPVDADQPNQQLVNALLEVLGNNATSD